MSLWRWPSAVSHHDLAIVADDSGLVKLVTLFYSPSKDAAPFRSPMKSSGTSLYYGTIPAGVISGASNISYYIEALDDGTPLRKQLGM